MKNELKGSTAAGAAKKTAAAEKPVEKTVSAEPDKKTVKTTKETATAAAAVKAPAKEKAAEKTVKVEKTEKTEKEVKTTAAKAPAKKTTVKETVYLQYLGKEIDKDDLMKQVKEIWTKEQKRKVSDLKSVSLYLKPEENAAYYVINDEVSGKIEL